MTPEKKQIELLRYRTILLATLDYLEERSGGSFVCDQYDPVTEYYQQQKIQTEKYFKQRRLDRLKQRLAGFTKELQSKIDLSFAHYIKEKTGYDIDIFEDLRKHIEDIIAQKEIRNQQELNDISTMLQFYRETKATGKKIEKLAALLTHYSKQTNEIPYKRKSGYSEVVCRVVKEGVEEVTVRFSTGPKPKHFEEHEVISPDSKRKLRVIQVDYGKHASTHVLVEFPKASGAVYQLNSICPDVKARWEDNSTIVIETKKSYSANIQTKQVRSFDDVIILEYIER